MGICGSRCAGWSAVSLAGVCPGIQASRSSTASAGISRSRPRGLVAGWPRDPRPFQIFRPANPPAEGGGAGPRRRASTAASGVSLHLPPGSLSAQPPLLMIGDTVSSAGGRDVGESVLFDSRVTPTVVTGRPGEPAYDGSAGFGASISALCAQNHGSADRDGQSVLEAR